MKNIINKVKKVKPVELVEPVESVEPVEPVEPVELIELVEPVEPVELIDIYEFLTELENIGDNNEKEEFIKNYSKIMEKIKKVDKILYETSQETQYETKNINELFNIIEANKNKILDSDNLNVNELKMFMDIGNILEKKINDSTIDISEIS